MKNLKILLLPILCFTVIGILSSADTPNKTPLPVNQHFFVRNGMEFLTVWNRYDGGIFVVNLTLDKAKLNYYNGLCE